MKRNNFKGLALTMILTMTLVATPLIAQPPHHKQLRHDNEQMRGRPGPPHGMERRGGPGSDHHMMDKREEFLKRLGLSEAQKVALKTFREERGELKIEMQRLKLQGMELMHLIKKSSSSDSEVLAKVNEINAQQAKINTARAQSALTLKKALSTEQFEKIVGMLERMKRHGKHGPPHGGAGGGHDGEPPLL